MDATAAEQSSDERGISQEAADKGAASGFTALFVRRPVLAIVVNLLIMVAGLAALTGIEIRELPEVDSPVVTISTDYEGASPDRP
jgi:HAE1 family hydrophobic/amphiphilic exporter-1